MKAHPKEPAARFKRGQIVCVIGIARIGDPDEFGVIDGFDDGRWHVKLGSKLLKCLPDILRPLSKKERGP